MGKLWTPSVGSQITAHLPNETVRATVSKVVNRNEIEVVLNVQYPMVKDHGHRFNSRVILHRKPMQPQGTKWESEEA